MLIVHVHVHVKEDGIEAFKQATLANARTSLKEPGVVRFDVIQEQERPERFVLVEVYRTPEDPARHKETEHYQTWRDAVAPMMAEPRQSTQYKNVFPEDARWDTIAGS
jgi:autoinducer 2-degrading protein